jgi:hypothetical protein
VLNVTKNLKFTLKENIIFIETVNINVEMQKKIETLAFQELILRSKNRSL